MPLPQAGPKQRAAMFPAFYEPRGAFTDELYAAHEQYIVTVTAALQDAMPLLKVRRIRICGARNAHASHAQAILVIA